MCVRISAVGLPNVSSVTCALIIVPPLLFVLLWGWYQWRYWHILVIARTLPSLSACPPILGHLYLGAFGLKHLVNSLINDGKKAAAKGTKVACLWFGPYPVFLALNENDAQIVLTSSKTSEKSGEYHFIRFALGRGLLIAPGDIHKVTRRHLNPLFQPANVALLVPLFNLCGRHIVTDLSRHVGGRPHNLLRSVTPSILRNTANGIFGADVISESSTVEFSCLSKAMKGITKVAINRILKVWLWSDSLFHYLWYNEIREIFSCRDKFVNGCLKKMIGHYCVLQNRIYLLRYIIQQNMCAQVKGENKEIMTNGKRDVWKPETQARTLFDAYEDLQRTDPQFTKQDLLCEIMTFMITGADSTNITVCSCLLALAAFPEIQDKVYQEIICIVGKGDDDVPENELNKLIYLEQVIKETLRKFSISPIILRRVDEDTQLSECTVPAGATIGVGIISLHYDPKDFPDPETFDPERFSPSNVTKRNKYSFIPFSGGSRGCIGKTYATMIVKTVLVHVLRRYRLSTTVDINSLQFNIAVILYSSTGYPVRLHHRDTQC